MATGTTIGAFEILEKLGAGGMGEVYRARDKKLGREVALKILPAALAEDSGRLERLEREARLIASLNHPNIATLYSVESAGEARALVLELVEGETLGARIRRSALTIAEARTIARQIIAALDAAHQCGIVHRDLKPDNVMIGPRGLVKVLDFGLAKTAPMAAAQASTVTIGPTSEGAIVGTAAYMSPEQARGLSVDRRTDIWAFGCVLYEMLARRRAFAGATLTDTIVATLEKEPDWTLLPRDTPPGIRRLLSRALHKDPHDRLRDIADALADLDEPAAAGSTVRGSSIAWLPWTVAAAAVAATASFWWLRPSTPASDPIAQSVLTPLTRDAGLTTAPALSKDGRLLAYASDRAGGGTLDIWVQQVAGGGAIRLTDNEADDTAPDFSPDGSQILFQSDRGGGGAYIVSAFGGGAPPRLVARDARQPRFSPDGSRIAYWSGLWRGTATAGRSGLFVVALSGGDPRQLASSFRGIRSPVWSPDGESLLFLGRSDANLPLADSFDWWWMKLDGSPPVKVGLLTEPLRIAESPPLAWTRDGVLFSDSQDLWLVDISPTTGRIVHRPRRLTVSSGAYTSAAASADGRIVLASTQTIRVIERAALDRSEHPSPPVQLYADLWTDAGRPTVTADGSIIVFDRPSANGIEVWTKNIRSGLEQLITRVDTQLGLSSTISPDGTRIAYNSDGYAGAGRGFVVETSRGVPSKICDECTVAGFLADSRRLLLVSHNSIQVRDVTTGTVEVAVKGGNSGLNRPHASPDGRWLAFRGGTESFVTRLTPGDPPADDSWMMIDEPTSSGRPAGWSLDSRMVYLLLDTDGFRCLWGQRLDASGRLDGTPMPVRHFHGADWAGLSTSYGNAVAPDGFVYATNRNRGNIWSLTRR